MTKKIKIVLMSDWVDTGFGTVTKELAARFADMDIFEVHVIGWHSTPNDVPIAFQSKVHLHTTQFWNAEDQFGKLSFETYMNKIRPSVVITLGDPWMTDHVASCKARDSFTWLAYVPIDRDVICLPWLIALKKPDSLVLFSQFGVDVVNSQMPFRAPRLILHGVDKMVFKPWYPEGTSPEMPLDELMAARKAKSFGPENADRFMVGLVCRNQVRKQIPTAMKAFKAFNCKTWTERINIDIKDPETGEVKQSIPAEEFCRNKQCFRCDICPAFQQREETERSVFYLHSTRGDGKDPHDRPGIGWRIDEIAHRLRLAGRVMMTPNISATHGLPRAALAQIMNCFDVHCFLSGSEGFGLPIAEGLSCGVPTLATNYSSMTELVSHGGGVPIDVRAFETFITWENEIAHADIGHAADEINKIFSDKEYAARMRKEAAESNYVPSWDNVANQFRKLILEAVCEQE
jgi:glycosyltransferase involved in cell wall biosynthesis